MSEPTIKPSAWMCPRCGGTPNEWHFKHANDVVVRPLYTHDALVAVAREARESASPQYSPGGGIDVEYTETPEAVVERLTGVKR